MQFKTGDIGSVHHDFSFHWKRLAQACIRFITRSHWDHTFIVWKDEQPMVQEFMFSMGDHPISKKYSLMNQIKNL